MYALGATLFTAVEGAPPFGTSGDMLALIMRISRGGAPGPRNAGPLTPLIGRLLADDPAARPTAAQAHQMLTQLMTPAGAPTYVPPDHRPAPQRLPATPEPPPAHRRRRLRTIALITLAVAVLGSAGAVAILRGGPGKPAGIADVRTADLCSLFDTAALSRYGVTVIDPENASFDGCRADLTPPSGDSLSVFTVLRAPLGPNDELGGTPQQIGAITLTRLPATENKCRRKLLLPDRYVISIFAQRFGVGTAELCAIADTAALTATTLITEHGIPTRTPPDAGTPLAGINACTLLTPAELVAVPGLPATGTLGPGGWSCTWTRSSGDEVEIYYYRSYPPSQTPDSSGVDIAGREADTRLGTGLCTAEFAEHSFTGRDGTRRVDNIQVNVYGSAPEAQLCVPATTLARAAAAKLPPPS